MRAQFPLMGGRSPPMFGASSPHPHHHHHHHQHLSGAVSPAHHHHHIFGEHMIKIRILEQENERQLRKIRALEQQLSELEQLHGARVQVQTKLIFDSLTKKISILIFPGKILLHFLSELWNTKEGKKREYQSSLQAFLYTTI